MLYTVRDILEVMGDSFDGAGTDCTENNHDLLNLFNKITRRLLREGDWSGSYADVCLPVCEQCFTLDARFGHILAVNLNGGSRTAILNRNYRYISDNTRLNDCACPAIEDYGFFPTHRDLPYSLNLMAISDRDECSATISFYGYDELGRELARVSDEGNRELGLKIEIKRGNILQDDIYYTGETHDFGGWTSGKAQKLTSIQKSRTNGYVYIYGYNPESHEIYWLTTLAPDETNPRLRRYYVPELPHDIKVMEARVALAYRPLFHDDDIAIIQNPDAYEFMTKSIASENQKDWQSVEIYKNKALSALRKQLRTENKNTKTGFNVNFNSKLAWGNFSAR